MDIGRAGSVLLLVNEMKCFGMRPSLVVTGPLHRVKQMCLTVSSICFQRPGLYFQTKSTTSPLIFVFLPFAISPKLTVVANQFKTCPLS